MKPLPPIEGYVLGERWKLDTQDFAVRRAIVNRFGTYEDVCKRARCRRAKACRSPTVACFDEQRDTLIDLVWEIIIEGYQPAPEAWEEE